MIKVDQEKCIGCGTCVSMCGECFEMIEHKTHPKSENCKCGTCDLKDVTTACPVGAIEVEIKQI